MKTSQKIIVITFAVIIGVASWYFSENKESPKGDPQSTPTLSTPSQPISKEGRSNSAGLLGEKILHDYATEKTTLKEDMELLRRLNLSFVTLVKDHAQTPIGCNEDLADALKGKNAYKQRFLPGDHSSLNEQGQIIDRYNTPVHIHVKSAGSYEVRSAGPDKKLFTDDDVNILPSGEYSN